jgi:hypothetical protein
MVFSFSEKTSSLAFFSKAKNRNVVEYKSHRPCDLGIAKWDKVTHLIILKDRMYE